MKFIATVIVCMLLFWAAFSPYYALLNLKDIATNLKLIATILREINMELKNISRKM